jgi:tetratricopeptide (TPR) repeat protein
LTPQPPPTNLSPQLLERYNEILARADSIDRSDYFSMLDLPREASPEVVASTFFSLAKKWHPDRLPPELAPVRDACSRVFGRLSEAHATLTDAEKRTKYMKLLAEGSGSPEVQERLARVVEAATTFQKAEVCLRRGDHEQAEGFCRKAMEADPTQPDYLAMFAWLIALKPENQSPEKTAESIHMLTKAISMGGKSEKPYFWRGMLLRRLGKAEAAVRDFREAVELNPRNIDAAREVRLYRMRGGRFSSGPPPSDASRLSRNTSSPRPAPNASKSGVSPTGTNKSGLLDRFFKK